MTEAIERAVKVGLAAVVDQQTEVHGTAGPADVCASTPFAWGSITKTVTGTLLARLAQDGTVRLEQTLDAWLPGAPALTLESLATHHSGLPRLIPGGFRAARRAASQQQPYAGEDETTVLAALRGTRVRHRHSYTYSNHGAGLLGLALSKATGLGYGELVQELVAGPLGLTTLTTEDPPDLAVPHTNGRVAPVWEFGDGVIACGGLRGSVEDLATWLRAALGEAPQPLAMALETATVPRATARGGHIGLGWHIGLPFVKESEHVLWHNGAINGSVSFGAADPGTGRVVALLANSNGSLDALGIKLLREAR